MKNASNAAKLIASLSDADKAALVAMLSGGERKANGKAPNIVKGAWQNPQFGDIPEVAEAFEAVRAFARAKHNLPADAKIAVSLKGHSIGYCWTE